MKLRDVCNYITRGCRRPQSIKDEENDKYLDYEFPFYFPTICNSSDWYYITIKSLNEGSIDKVYLMDKPRREYECFKLHDGDIIIPLIGPKFKPTIYDKLFPYVDSNECDPKFTIIASGNLCIIDVDKKRVDPYYLMTVLRSKEVFNFLNERSKGVKSKVITKEDILEIEIPEIDMVNQKKIANEYKNESANISKMLSKLESIYNLDVIIGTVKKLKQAQMNNDVETLKRYIQEMELLYGGKKF